MNNSISVVVAADQKPLTNGAILALYEVAKARQEAAAKAEIASVAGFETSPEDSEAEVIALEAIGRHDEARKVVEALEPLSQKARESEAKTLAAIKVVEERLATEAEEAFVTERERVAEALASSRNPLDRDVSRALRGQNHPGWRKVILERFLAMAQVRGSFHGVVEETLAEVQFILAEEVAKKAKAAHIKDEAQRRQEASRRDCAERQSRGAKGGKKK